MSTILNKPYDAFADEGADEEVVEEAKKAPKQGAFNFPLATRQGVKAKADELLVLLRRRGVVLLRRKRELR